MLYLQTLYCLFFFVPVRQYYGSWILINIYTGGDSPERKRIHNNNITRNQSIKRVFAADTSYSLSLIRWRAHAHSHSFSPREMAHNVSKFFSPARTVKGCHTVTTHLLLWFL
jgi:hypothetical protein